MVCQNLSGGDRRIRTLAHRSDPDFIPVLGYLDDLILLPALITWCVKCIPSEVFADCRSRADGMWGKGKPEKWYYAIPFVLIWAALIALIVLAFI